VLEIQQLLGKHEENGKKRLIFLKTDSPERKFTHKQMSQGLNVGFVWKLHKVGERENMPLLLDADHNLHRAKFVFYDAL